MAISGQKHIRIGAENNSAESDSIHAAFVKIEDNFNNLFTNSSQYTTFTSGEGINVNTNPTLGRVTVTNTGVINLIEGSGIKVSGSNGDVTISVSGDANGNIVAGVTKVGVLSSTLEVLNSPVISEGNIAINLSEVGTILEGDYVAPALTVDKYGRITSIANADIAGTVTSVAVTAGPGLAVTGSPVTSSGEITINNTGVLRLTAGAGIQLTDSTGNITISATQQQLGGTVTRVGVLSNSLNVTQSPVTTSGNIVVELPDNITLSGDLSADNGSLTGNLEVSGDLTITGATTLDTVTSGAITSGAITSSGNVTGANLVTAGVLTATGNATVGNIIANIANITTAKVSGNANVGNVIVTGVVTATGNITGGNISTAGSLTVTGNLNYNRVCGSFYSNVSQTLSGANTATAMTLNNAPISDDVTIVDNSKITIGVIGRYNIQFSAQLSKSSSGSDVIDIWLAKNGVNEAWTNTDITLVGNNAKAVASWNFVVDVTQVGTYYQLMWSCPDTAVSIVASNPASNPTRPGIPSLIVTVTPVGA